MRCVANGGSAARHALEIKMQTQHMWQPLNMVRVAHSIRVQCRLIQQVCPANKLYIYISCAQQISITGRQETQIRTHEILCKFDSRRAPIQAKMNSVCTTAQSSMHSHSRRATTKIQCGRRTSHKELLGQMHRMSDQSFQSVCCVHSPTIFRFCIFIECIFALLNMIMISISPASEFRDAVPNSSGATHLKSKLFWF